MMKNKRDYFELDKHFIAPKVISPFFNVRRIPRKLKKLIKKNQLNDFLTLELNILLWYRLSKINPDYHRFIIKKICKQYEQTEKTITV